MNLKHAMKNPNVVFASPEALEASSEFTTKQKSAILKQWKDQLEQLLIADQEGMPRSGEKAGTNAERLRQVTDTLRRLVP